MICFGGGRRLAIKKNISFLIKMLHPWAACSSNDSQHQMTQQSFTGTYAQQQIRQSPPPPHWLPASGAGAAPENGGGVIDDLSRNDDAISKALRLLHLALLSFVGKVSKLEKPN